MKQGALIYGFFGLLIGLVVGFWIANAYSRSFSTLPAVQSSIPSQQAQALENSGEKLSREEIAASFAAAENRKNDLVFQKNLGLALARYASVQNDSSFLPELIALLERANQLSSEKDTAILIALGDVYFIQAREKPEPEFFEKARSSYRRAALLKPNDAEIKVAYAATFLYSKPARPDTAITELNSILKQHPNNESALQLLIAALLRSGKIELAEQKLSELKKINSNNPAIPDLEAQLSQNKIKLDQ